MQNAILEIAEKYPQMSITVAASDLADFGAALVSRAVEKYKAERDAADRAEREEIYFTESEAAAYLGVSKHTLYRWRGQQYIAYETIGGRIRYRKSECRRIRGEKTS